MGGTYSRNTSSHHNNPTTGLNDRHRISGDRCHRHKPQQARYGLIKLFPVIPVRALIKLVFPLPARPATRIFRDFAGLPGNVPPLDFPAELIRLNTASPTTSQAKGKTVELTNSAMMVAGPAFSNCPVFSIVLRTRAAADLRTQGVVDGDTRVWVWARESEWPRVNRFVHGDPQQRGGECMHPSARIFQPSVRLATSQQETNL